MVACKRAPEICACLNEDCTGLHDSLGLRPTSVLLVGVGQARLLLAGPSGQAWMLDTGQGQEVTGQDLSLSLNESPVEEIRK